MKIGGNLIPHTSKIGSLAKGAFAGGLLGSIFDPPNESSPNTGHLSVGTPILQVTNVGNSFSSGTDSNLSGMT